MSKSDTLSKYICIVNGNDISGLKVFSKDYFNLREVSVSAQKLSVLKLKNGNTVGCVIFFNDEKECDDFSNKVREDIWSKKSKDNGQKIYKSDCVRNFSVCTDVSQKTIDVSGLSVRDCNAVLVINGTLDGMSMNEFNSMISDTEAVNAFGEAFGSQPGLICKHVLCSRYGEQNIIGGCYLFKSVEDIETYLNSEFWLGVEKDTKWKNVVGEVFRVI